MLVENKPYMRLAIRFLNDLNLLPIWKEYINSKESNPRYEEHQQKHHWSDKKDVTFIFGETRFSSYLRDKYNISFINTLEKDYLDRKYIYEIFDRYVMILKRYGYEEAKKYANNCIVKGGLKHEIFVKPF